MNLNNLSRAPSTDASDQNYFGGNTDALVVLGLIENARGCDTSDYNTTNELANVLRRDQGRTGVDANDTLNGAARKDKLYGGAAGDYLCGSADNDTLEGDAGTGSTTGADTVEGGATASDRVV